MLREKNNGDAKYSVIKPSYSRYSWDKLNKTAIHNIETTWSRLTNEEQKKILSEFEENNATNTAHTHENQKKSPSPSIEAIRSLAGFVDIIAGTFAVAFQVVTSAYPIPFETGAVLIIIDGAFTISFIIKWTCYRSYSKGNQLFSGYKWQGFYTKKRSSSLSFSKRIQVGPCNYPHFVYSACGSKHCDYPFPR